jgi:hypothetical protein
VRDGLKKLAEYMYNHFNGKVIILIDEFDAPIMKLIHSSEDAGLSYIKKVTVFGELINACVLLSAVL